jgi:hypothetical protein
MAVSSSAAAPRIENDFQFQYRGEAIRSIENGFHFQRKEPTRAPELAPPSR